MKDFYREYPLLSLCGLSCGLCTMHLGGYCPGCGGGDGNQSCAIARCSREHSVEFCCHCSEYPCVRYETLDAYDSFISTRNLRKNQEKVRTLGLGPCKVEMEEKISLLSRLLEKYNAGRQKSFFSTAVNLLELDDLRVVLEQLEAENGDLPERAKRAAELLRRAAENAGIEWKLRKKPKTK